MPEIALLRDAIATKFEFLLRVKETRPIREFESDNIAMKSGNAIATNSGAQNNSSIRENIP